MSNKLQERIYLDWFLKKQDFTYEYLQETERPDFILTRDGQSIGIEICNYYVGPRVLVRSSSGKIFFEFV